MRSKLALADWVMMGAALMTSVLFFCMYFGIVLGPFDCVGHAGEIKVIIIWDNTTRAYEPVTEGCWILR